MNFKFEKGKQAQGFVCVIGCDEVGRGSLAGPVVAAAVVMRFENWDKRQKLKDSKLLLPKQREHFSALIKRNAVCWATAQASEKEIDRLNIHRATLLAMKRAVEKILPRVSSETAENFLAVDGKFAIPELNIPQAAVVGGDGKIFSIAAASILAKVFRDDLMRRLDAAHPQYGLKRHKGYGTLHHRRAIKKLGLTPIHRRTFCSHLV